MSSPNQETVKQNRHRLRTAEDSLLQETRERHVAESILNIIPEAKAHPDLYNRVVKRISEANFGRCRTWSDYQPIKHFYGWALTAGENDKPDLEILISLLAVHRTLAHTTNDKFAIEVENRGLKEWVAKKLRSLKGEGQSEELTKREKRRKKKKPTVKVENSEEVEEGVIQGTKRAIEESIIHTIERDLTSPRNGFLPKAQPVPKFITASPKEPYQCQPVPEPQAAIGAPTADNEPAKRQRTEYLPPPRRIANCDNSAQTDEAMLHSWVLQNLSKFVKPIKEAFEDVVAAQTETLTRTVPNGLQNAIQQAVAAEANRQRNAQIAPPRAQRNGPLANLGTRRQQQPYLDGHHPGPARPPATPRGPAYDEGMRGDRRGRANWAPEGERVMDFQEYEYRPEALSRRY
ncbi:Fc.00g044340.m01.CDS01 [Cosmosporella sp. VM-42]